MRLAEHGRPLKAARPAAAPALASSGRDDEWASGPSITSPGEPAFIQASAVHATAVDAMGAAVVEAVVVEGEALDKSRQRPRDLVKSPRGLAPNLKPRGLAPRSLECLAPTPPAVSEAVRAAKPRQAEVRQAELAAAEEGAAVAFTSSGRVRTAPQRLDASVLAASLHGKHGSAREASRRKEAALQEEEKRSAAAALRLRSRSSHNEAPNEQRACGRVRPWRVGERVLARYGTRLYALARTKWFQGTISATHDDGTCDVAFDDGDFEAQVPAACLEAAEQQQEVEEEEQEEQEGEGEGEDEEDAGEEEEEGEQQQRGRASEAMPTLDVSSGGDEGEGEDGGKPRARPQASGKPKGGKPKRRLGAALCVGDAVEAHYGEVEAELWWPAVVTKVWRSGEMDVRYDDGDVELQKPHRRVRAAAPAGGDEWRVGSRLEALDKVSAWCFATVLAMRGEGHSRMLKVHYMGWSSKWDQWLAVSGGRLRWCPDA